MSVGRRRLLQALVDGKAIVSDGISPRRTICKDDAGHLITSARGELDIMISAAQLAHALIKSEWHIKKEEKKLYKLSSFGTIQERVDDESGREAWTLAIEQGNVFTSLEAAQSVASARKAGHHGYVAFEGRVTVEEEEEGDNIGMMRGKNA